VTRPSRTPMGSELDPFAGGSIDAARRRLAREFRRGGLDAPDLDARIIVGHALGLDHTALAAQSSRMLAAEEAGAIAALSARRLKREPVARILGRKEFWGLPLKVNAETLLPRPETETVVEAALAALDCEHRKSRALRIVDLGTGSGALLLALLSELPSAFGVGTDISFAALRCAHDNAAALGLSARAGHCGVASRGARLRSAPRTRRRARRPRWLSCHRAPCGAPARTRRHPGARTRTGSARPRDLDPRRSGAHTNCATVRSCGRRPGPCFTGAAMRAPHSWYEKKHLDCGSRPTRFRSRNRPEIVERR